MAKAVRSWYIAATPEIGITAIEGAYGFLVRSDRVALRRVVLTVDSASLVRDALAEVTEFFGASGFDVWVDRRDRSRRLTSELGLAGFAAVQDTVVLPCSDPCVWGPAPRHCESRRSLTMTGCESGRR